MVYMKEKKEEKPTLYMLYRYPAMMDLDFRDVPYVESAANFPLDKGEMYTCVEVKAEDVELAISEGLRLSQAEAKKAAEERKAQFAAPIPPAVEPKLEPKPNIEKVIAAQPVESIAHTDEVVKAVVEEKKKRGRPPKVKEE